MLKAKVYNQEGNGIEEINLSEKMFGLKLNNDLLHQAVVAQMSNSREVLADTKGRGEVRGGGKKPWKQKGTGRARHGSIRSPIWKGGGVVFGPKSNRNFSKKINKKMKTKALFIALSAKLRDNELLIIDSLKMEKPSTKNMKKILESLHLNGTILIAMGKKDNSAYNSARNIPNVSMVACNSLNVADILNHKNLLINKDGIKDIEKTYKIEFNKYN